MVSLAEANVETNAITMAFRCSSRTVYRWIQRKKETGDLQNRPRSGRKKVVYTEEVQLRIIAFYCQTTPLHDLGRWSLRWAAMHLEAYPDELGVSPSKSTLHRILKSNGLKPHLSRYFLHITDPDFFPKMEHLVALYQNPPSNLYFFDECPGIQVIKRLTPDLQTEETKQRLEEFEYIRNGTLDVFAFLNHADGKVSLECQPDHTGETFLGVFRRHVSRITTTDQIHYVMDNLTCHFSYSFCQLVAELSDVPCPPPKELNSSAKRVEWLRGEDKRIIIHFTPYHGSWLNLIEIWFGILKGKVLTESFGSPDDLKAAIEAFEREWNLLLAHPFRWDYNGEGLHEKAVKRFTAMLQKDGLEIDVKNLTKLMMLMTNMLNDYYSKVPEELWQELATSLFSQFAAISELIQQEKGPIRKVKAEKAFDNLNSVLSELYPPSLDEAA